jgi:hypothetical protein
MLLLLVAGNANAVICTPLNSPKWFVGNTAANNLCNFDDVQSAIDHVTGSCPNTIYITHDHTYTSQHLTISNKAMPIALVGMADGVPCGSTNPQICDPVSGCPPPPTAPLLTLDASNTTGSVLHLDGTSNVTLRFLTLKGGATALGSAGGGIFFSGNGSLTLDTMTVSNNAAGYGGGIYVNGDGGNATLTLQANTLILNNTAQYSGGGIRIDGSTKLTAEAPQTLIAFNEAQSDGGGLSVLGPARADIGSSGYNGLAVIYSNKAPRGGGVSVFGGGNVDGAETGILNMYTIDPSSAVGLQGNFASIAGGAIYSKGHQDQSVANEAQICLNEFRIQDNAAPDGAAIFVDWDTSLLRLDVGGYLDLNANCFYPVVIPYPFGKCAKDVPCNLIANNIAEDELGQPTDGAVVLIGNESFMSASQVAMRNNRGGTLLYLSDSYDVGELEVCLLADNSTSRDLLVLGLNFGVYSCTIAGNTIGGTWVFQTVDAISNSIIFQDGTSVGDVRGSSVSKYILSSDISHLPADTTIAALVDPKFVNAAAGDYHLRADSPAVDYAPPDTVPANAFDLDKNKRPVDVPKVANKFGPLDLGAYERESFFDCDNTNQANDAVFCGTFDL